MATASVGLSSPATAPGLPQLPEQARPAVQTPEKPAGVSSSPGSVDSAGSRVDEPNAPSSDAADDSTLRHPKGKRKRTAAKDKAILEAAYLANPKPDKTARLDIVNQVSLNEKEVQIWFQNRRQNDRRKSRPLSPQEIAALRLGGIHALSSDPSSFFSYSSGIMSSSPPQLLTPNGPSTTPLSSPELGPWESEALARKREEEQRQQQQQNLGVRTLMPSLSFTSSTGSVGYLANRWNAHSSFDPSLQETFSPILPLPHQQQQEQQQQKQQQQRPVRPTQRPFRLSLSLEGKAEVIASMSPSPPRHLPPPQPMPAPVPFGNRRTNSIGSNSSLCSSAGDSPLAALPAIQRAGLNRSQSHMSSLGGSGLTLPPISSLTGSLESGSLPAPVPASSSHLVHPPRLLRGRSRDVHAWVSVCDADTRIDDELSAQAQDEASGSAIAAISLLRSTSSSSLSGVLAPSASVLQPNGARRNTAARSTVSRPGVKRSKLSRTMSSVARLQSVASAAPSADRVWMDDEKKKKLKLSALLSGNDSDKENWSPDEDRSFLEQMRQNRKQLVRPAGRMLGGGHVRSTSEVVAKRPIGGSSGGRAIDIYEDAVSDDGRPTVKQQQQQQQRAVLSRAATAPGTDDVERFMRGGEVSPSKKGDLDCVAGLLSLSQGIWR